MTTKAGILVAPETPPEDVLKMAAESRTRGLRIASIYGGNFLKQGTVAGSVTNLQRLIDHVGRCECPHLLLGGTSRAELVNDYYTVVAECCGYAAARGVVLTIKPHGGTNSTGPQCRRLIENVGRPNFKLWYDPGNIFYYSDGKLNPVDDARSVDGLVAGMSVKDFRLPKEVNVTPGTGQVDFAAVMAQLRRGGFRGGPLIVECLAPGSAPEVTAEARKARRFVEELVGQPGTAWVDGRD
jgi:sugar phosphate isomerase/epimerase